MFRAGLNIGVYLLPALRAVALVRLLALSCRRCHFPRRLLGSGDEMRERETAKLQSHELKGIWTSDLDTVRDSVAIKVCHHVPIPHTPRTT